MTGLRCAVVSDTPTPMVPVKGQTAMAWAVVAAMLLIGGLILVVSAFSQNNEPASITGRTATTSQNLP